MGGVFCSFGFSSFRLDVMTIHRSNIGLDSPTLTPTPTIGVCTSH